MPTLRLLPSGPGPDNQAGEVLACCYTPVGDRLLAAGWDGHLRLWDTSAGAHLLAIPVGDKPVCACAVSPDNKHFVSGNLQGMLAVWDSATGRQVSVFLAHTRPISSIQFSVDGKTVATASYDGNVTLWNLGKERDGRIINAHRDIVAGCRFTPDGKSLVSWSYDGTVKLWDPVWGQPIVELGRHADRVTAGGVSPDSRWLASGARDGTLRLWNLPQRSEEVSVRLPAEVRACLFLLDGETLIAADAAGRLTVHQVPSLEEQMELVTHLPTQCADLAPSAGQLALGCSDGRVRFLAVDGLDGKPMIVNVTQTSRRTQTTLQRLLGKSRITQFYHCICPACRTLVDLPTGAAGVSAQCPHCHQTLRVSAIAQVVQETPGN